MKYHNKTILCLEYDEFVPQFMSEANYSKARQRGKLLVYGRGGNGTSVLIDYEALPVDIKAKVQEKYGDPYQYIVKQPLKEWAQINWNRKAYEFYNSYPLPTGGKLPEKYRDKYTKAVTYMDGISHYTTDKLALKRDFNINMQAFWAIVADVIRAEEVALPANEIRLKERIRIYKAKGFESLIEKFRFANDNSKKVKDQLAEDVLMKLIADGNKHDETVIATVYNEWAKANGRKTITGSAVSYRRRMHYYEVAVERDGKAMAYNQYSKQTKQARPTAPLMLINSDDNVLDLYFKSVSYVNKRKVVNNYWRPVMYVVMDCYNDYILGYAVGETVTIDLVKEAYRNAMQHIVALTGQPHLWYQIKTDKWSIDPKLEGELATFLKMGGDTQFFPASVAQSKYIERVFAKPLNRILKLYPNYSGANITAKSANSRVNTDALQKRAKDFPDKSKAPQLIELTIHNMRHALMPGTDKSRQQVWLEAFNESDFSRGLAISNEKKLELLGVTHQPAEPVRLLASGLKFQLNKVQYHFDIPAELFPECQNRKVELIYDPADMSQVLVTDHKGLRFVADAYKFQPSAIADMSEGDGKMLNERKQAKKLIAQKLVDYVESREDRLQRAQIDAQSLLQANVLTKEINHQAVKLVTGGEVTILEERVKPVKKVSEKPVKQVIDITGPVRKKSIYDKM